MTGCRRCGAECGDHGYDNSVCNPWAAMCEVFTLCSKCQVMLARKLVSFLNDPEARQ